MANSKDLNSRVFKIWIIASWYFSNISILFLNKYLLTNNGFKRTIFLTMCHMTACSLISYVAIMWMKMVPMQKLRSRKQFLKMAALWVVFCISVVSGNVSLQYLPLSFTQAVGATSPFFTTLFAFLVTAKQEAWTTYATLIPVILGMVMASGGEPSLHLLGFIFCVVATAARALESVLQGTLLSSEGESMNSMNLLLYMAPISLLLLFLATLWWEQNAVGVLLALAKEDIRIIWYLLFNSALTFFINLANFLVRKHTSPLTLQVLGDAKGGLAAVLSICIFKNQTTVKGFLGHVLTVIGAVLYHEAKRRHERSSNIG